MASAAAAICKQLLVSRESSPKVSRSTLLASLSSQLDAILLNNNSSKDIADIKIAQRLGKAKETLQLLINPDHLLKSLLEDLKSVGIDGETSSSDSENNQHHQIITAATTSTIIKSSASSSFITTQVVADPLTDNELFAGRQSTAEKDLKAFLSDQFASLQREIKDLKRSLAVPNGSNSAVNVGGGGLSITTTTSNNNNNNAPVSPLIQDLINNNGGSPRRSSVGAFEQSRKPVRRLSSAQLFSMLSKPATPSTTSQKDVKEDTRITLSSRHVRQLKKHLNSLSELRQQMALLRQTFNTNNSDISCAMGEILKLTTDLREKAIKENEEDGRKLLLSAKSRLESQAEQITSKLKELQEEVDELKSDCVIRKCRLDEKKMQRIGEESKKLQEDIVEFSDFVVQVKPSWKAIWERELQGIVKEQTYLKEEEAHSVEIEDEFDAMMAVYETLEKLMELQSKNDVIIAPSLQVATAEEVREGGIGGVLAELQMTVRDDDTQKRISAIERIEQRRLKKVQHEKEEGNEFTNELRSFVGNRRLKKTGGIEEVERRRKKQDESNLDKIAAFLQEMELVAGDGGGGEEMLTSSPEEATVDNNSNNTLSSSNEEAGGAGDSGSLNTVLTLFRVKLYWCSEEGQWIDKGTGHVSCCKGEDGVDLVVASEESNVIILKTALVAEDIYHRQQETLIVWMEPNGANFALSFQEASGCNDIWEQIISVQRELALLQPVDKIEDVLSVDEYMPAARALDLPEPSLGNLLEIEKILTAITRTVWGRDQLTQYILNNEFLQRLLPLLDVCEDLDNIEDLYTLSSIVRMLVLLNDTTIYEYILREEIYVQVIGILEYDREYSHKKANYRHHILNVAKFKQVIPIAHKDIVSKINLTYRVQYLKDVVIARLMDDGIFSTFNSIIFYNHLEILTYISQEHTFLGQLFDSFNSDSSSLEQKRDVILFLNEMCSTAKSLPNNNRNSYYRALGQHGLFQIFEHSLGDEEPKIRLASVAILSNLLDHDPAMVRSFCLAQLRQNQNILLGFVITRFMLEADEGIRSQLAECLRVMLDTSKADQGMEGLIVSAPQDNDIDDFLNMFYEKYMPQLMDPVLTIEADFSETQLFELGRDRANLCNHICELLSFAVKNHTYRSKYYILGSKIIEKMCLLLKCKETYVRLSALRVFRTCIGLKDEFYNRHLLKHDVFGPILEAFKSTNEKYNLLNSACLEFFEFIKKENMKSLIVYLVEKYRKMFESITYVGTFKNLVLRYEQGLDQPVAESQGPAVPQLPNSATAPKDGWARIDRTEEDYFSSADEEEEALPTTLAGYSAATAISSSASSLPSALSSSAASLSPTFSPTLANPDSSLSPKPDCTNDSKSVSSPPPLLSKLGGASDRKITFVKGSPSLVDYPDDDDEDEFPPRKRKAVAAPGASEKFGFGLVTTLVKTTAASAATAAFPLSSEEAAEGEEGGSSSSSSSDVISDDQGSSGPPKIKFEVGKMKKQKLI